MPLPGANQTVELRRRSGSSRDEYGNPVEVFTAVATYRANLFTTTRSEIVDGLITEVKEHRCLLPAKAQGEVEPRDVVVGEDGIEHRVEAVISRRDHFGRIHHITLDLKESK